MTTRTSPAVEPARGDPQAAAEPQGGGTSRDLFFELRSVRARPRSGAWRSRARIVDLRIRSAPDRVASRHHRARVLLRDRARDGCRRRRAADVPAHGIGKLFGRWLARPDPSARVLERATISERGRAPSGRAYRRRGLQCIVPESDGPDKELVKYGTEIWHRLPGAAKAGKHPRACHPRGRRSDREARGNLGHLAETLPMHFSYAGLGGPIRSPVPRVIQPDQSFCPRSARWGGRSGRPPPSASTAATWSSARKAGPGIISAASDRGAADGRVWMPDNPTRNW